MGSSASIGIKLLAGSSILGDLFKESIAGSTLLPGLAGEKTEPGGDATGSMLIEQGSSLQDTEAARLQRERQRKRTSAGSGRSDTVKTGPQGLGELGVENREVKTLLGY